MLTSSVAVWIYAVMLKRVLGLLLVFSWISLSGFDVTEDLDLPDQIEFKTSTDSPIATHGPAGLLARNIIESADLAPSRCPNLLEQFATLRTTCIPYHFQKTSKLHKIHRVFLI